MITPDHYVLDRDKGTVIEEFIAVQTAAVIHAPGGGTTEVDLSAREGGARVLDARQLQTVCRMGLRLEQFFGKPQDVEWCFGQGDLLLLQSRPITTM
jgi:pyruvate,water dikinase